MANAVVELLRGRFAGRSISTEPLPEQIVGELMEAARLTPSCFNNQPWRFLFLLSEESRSRGFEVLSKGNQPWASRAPLLIIGYAKAKDDCQLPGRDYYQFDLGMSVMNIMLAATHHDLAARPMAGFDPVQAKEVFGLEDDDEPLIAMAVGYTAEDEDHLPEHYVGRAGQPRERKDVSEIIRKL